MFFVSVVDILVFLANTALERFTLLSARYRRIRKQIALLKDEASSLKREIRRMKASAEDSLARDDVQELEDDLAEILSSENLVLEARGSITLPSGLGYDFSQVPFPELGGGPGPFWGGSLADESGRYEAFGSFCTAEAFPGSLSNS